MKSQPKIISMTKTHVTVSFNNEEHKHEVYSFELDEMGYSVPELDKYHKAFRLHVLETYDEFIILEEMNKKR